MTVEHSIKIALMGPFGSGNLGDAATQDAMIANVRQRFPSAEIFGISVYPEDTEARHGIKSFPMHPSVRTAATGSPQGQSAAPDPAPVATSGLERLKAAIKRCGPLYHLLQVPKKAVAALAAAVEELRFMIACYRAIKGIDLLLCSGGGQLDDHWGGPWVQPFALFRWALVARLAGVKFGFVSVGVGHLDSPVSRFLIRRALSWAAYRTFRDPRSAARVAQLGIEDAGAVFPDLAYSLPHPHHAAQEPRLVSDKFATVGVNVIPYCAARGWPDREPAVYQEYLTKIATVVAWLAERGLKVVIFPTAEAMDMLAVGDLESRLLKTLSPELRARITIDPVKGVKNLLLLLRTCDLVITSRFHGVLLSFVVGTPAIGLSYHWKIDEVMKECGQEASCFDIRTATVAQVQAAFERLSNEGASARTAIQQRVHSSERQLAAQYDQLFAMVEKTAQHRPGRP